MVRSFSSGRHQFRVTADQKYTKMADGEARRSRSEPFPIWINEFLSPHLVHLNGPYGQRSFLDGLSRGSPGLATTFSSCLTFGRVAAETRSHRRGRVQGPTSNGLRLLIKLLDRYDRSKPSVPHWYLQLHVTRQGDNKARCAYR